MQSLKLKLFLFLLLIGFCNALLAATTGKISGIVTDKNTRDPLPGLNVVVEGTTLGAATDMEGYYFILNIPAGEFTVSFSMIGFATKKVTDVRVNIDQTTNLSIEMSEEALEFGEAITVVAERPVVERDVAGSRVNITSEEIEAVPVVSVTGVVGLQAGIENLSIRGGNVSEVAFVVDGLTLRDERDSSPFTNVSLTAVEEMQVQAGGFNAEYGNIRSGIINVITKEGRASEYNISFLGTYGAPSAKHFGPSPNDPNTYWIRPYVDPAVAWTGTDNAAWDRFTRRQYADFPGGWNAISEETLKNENPNDDLTPAAAQQLFLFEHRRILDVQIPDYTIDGSFGGPVPYLSNKLGKLRFFTSYLQTQNAYIIPLTENAYRRYTWNIKFTSDIGQGKKLMVAGFLGRETGVDRYNSGRPGIFTESWQIGDALSNGPKYIDARMFNTDYWGPAQTDFTNLGIKWTQVLNPNTFYEVSFNMFRSEYEKGTSRPRDNSRVYKFGNNYYVDEAPFGFEPASVSGINGMRMGAGMSNARDSSKATSYQIKGDFNHQLNRRNNLKFGGDFVITRSQINYAQYDEFLPRNNVQTKWDETPLRGALYVQDKIEYEGMIATLGLRMDYSYAGGQWYNFYANPYSSAFTSGGVVLIDDILEKQPADRKFTFSPRLAVAFPVTTNSKLYFNYGHFRQLPLPDDLYLIRLNSYTGQITRIGNPNPELQKTIAYELGYEHNLFNQLLIRTAGYYKDITLQPKLVTYEDFEGEVRYNRTEPTNYEDIRGFEITLNKNRGNWIKGFVNYTYMVSTYGYFGYGFYSENPTEQRRYERETDYYYQRKPKPRPYARANIYLISPPQFGPYTFGIKPLSDWRFNFLANWKAGRYSTWVGGGSVPGVNANVQWVDYWDIDIRLSKLFRLKNIGTLEFFLDVNNLFNYKYMTDYGFVDVNDKNAYFKSLHLPSSTEALNQFSYFNIPGDDKPGMHRDPGVEFFPIVVIGSTDDTDRSERWMYYNRDDRQFYWWDAQNQIFYQDNARTDRVLDDKAYIDMPNQEYFTFLSPRNFFWGIRFSVNL